MTMPAELVHLRDGVGECAVLPSWTRAVGCEVPAETGLVPGTTAVGKVPSSPSPSTAGHTGPVRSVREGGDGVSSAAATASTPSATGRGKSVLVQI